MYICMYVYVYMYVYRHTLHIFSLSGNSDVKKHVNSVRGGTGTTRY